jgi:hypothetical protein
VKIAARAILGSGTKVTVEVTLTIDPATVAEGKTPAIVAADLLQLGGSLISWGAQMNGRPARVRFVFEDEEQRERFIRNALAVPGVALAPSV